jgi:hypothetical protein
MGERTMSTRLWLTTILCITAFSMNVAFAADGFGKNKAAKEDDDNRGFDTPEEKERKAKAKKVNPELNKEFTNIAILGKLDASTQKKLLTIQKRKEKASEDFDQKNAKSIERSEKASTSENKSKSLAGTQALKRIEVKRKQTLAKFDVEVHKLLTPLQKGAIDGDTLWQSIREHFEEFRFSEAQNKKSAQICAEMAKGYRGRGSIGKNRSKKKAAMKRIAKEVFTDDQKKDYKREQSDRRRAAADAANQKAQAEKDKRAAERKAQRKEDRKNAR